jgi:hypothetical protein
MNGTSVRVRRSSDAQRLEKLCRMLRNTLRNYPRAKLLHGKDGFGALLGDGISLYVRWSGHLAPADVRDLLALFVTWLAVDPQRLVDPESEAGGGASRMETELAYLSNGPLG